MPLERALGGIGAPGGAQSPHLAHKTVPRPLDVPIRSAVNSFAP